MFKNIMLAVDGSQHTDSVIKTGIAMAKAFHSKIHVISVADIRIFEWATAVGADGFVPIVPSGIYQEESKKLLVEKCDKVLQKCAEMLQHENIDFITEKIIGSPVDSITEKAQLTDLLILGKHGEFARWDKKSLGATVEAVTRNIRKPVIVVQQKMQPVKKILVCYDGSSHANQMLQYAGHLAETLMAVIDILCVTNNKQLGEHTCTEAKVYLDNYKIKCNTHVIPGNTEKEILKFANENDSDIITLGSYGKSRIREALLGSTTEHILRFSPCQVLLGK